jgi:hypothetical protein
MIRNHHVVANFRSFAPTVRTLRQFIAACTDLGTLMRDVMLPDPVWLAP